MKPSLNEDHNLKNFQEKDFISFLKKNENCFKINYFSKCPVIPKFYWYNTKFNLGSIKSEGIGSSFNKNQAKMASICEALEWTPFSNKNMIWQNFIGKSEGEIKNSNGTSFDLDIEKSIIKSVLEKIERQVVLDAWLNKKDVYEIIGLFNLNLINTMSSFLNKLNSKFIYFPNKYGVNVVSCILYNTKRKPFFISGFGASTNIEKAILKSFFEAWRFLWNFKHVSYKKQCNIEENHSFEEHFLHYANNYRAIDNIYKINEKIFFKDIKKNNEELGFNEAIDLIDGASYIDLTNYNMIGYITKVFAKDMIDLWVGPLKNHYFKRNVGEIHPIG